MLRSSWVGREVSLPPSSTSRPRSHVKDSQGQGPGGWKAARVVITLLPFSDKPDLVACHLLVEVPEVNREGVIRDELAQVSAAASADAAAARVAGRGYTTAEQLVARVHAHLPSNLWESEPGYTATPEYRRLEVARRNAWDTGQERWATFLAQLREAFPRCTVEDWTVLRSDNCWRVRLYLPDTVPLNEGGEEHRAVVGLVSILAPVSVTYTSFHRRQAERRWHAPTLFYDPVPEKRDAEARLADLLRSELGAPRLPNDTLFTPLPDIQYAGAALGQARLIDCLFTTDRW
jgi:hypothetical protein